MGNPATHYELSVAYYEGEMVQRDRKKEKYHLEEAAIGGHVNARSNLAVHEAGNGNIDRAIKHFLIAACQGHNGALASIRYYYEIKNVTKEQYEAAIRGHQTAVEATKSPQREIGAQALGR